MLGRTIRDPDGMESAAGEAEGLGLLPAVTRSRSREADAGGHRDHARRRPVRRLRDPSRRHDARSERRRRAVRAAGRWRRRRRPWRRESIGTYLHGAFEHPDVCAEVFGIDAPSATVEGRTSIGGWPRGSSSTARHLDQLGSGLDHSISAETRHMHWELLLQQPSFDLRRSGRFLVADLKEPHQVLSTSVRHGGQVDHRASPAESSELRRDRSSRSASRHDRGRSRRVSRSRLRGGWRCRRSRRPSWAPPRT